jgi:hypothetical protein
LASSRKLLVQGHFVADQFARLFACFLSLPEHFSLTVQAENALSSFDRMIHTLRANSTSFGRRTFR